MARATKATKPATQKAPKSKKPDGLEGQADPRAPLDQAAFLKAAEPVMKRLKEDLAARAKASPAVSAALAARHADEVKAKRTADGLLEWQARFVDQVAAAWLCSCVFVRTLEDRGLLGHNRLAGPGAADSLKLFRELGPSLTERDYLLTVFKELSRFEATARLFSERDNPVWLLAPSAEAAQALMALFAWPSREEPAFRFGMADTAFLGWVYQDLDAGVRERFALLQTPRFVESFILDRTLDPAIDTIGLNDVTLIDPTCGSGHFLLGAFERLVERRLIHEPALGEREAARRALDAVYGADVNPYAVAIARFRLTLAFLDRGGYTRLAGAPAPPLHIVVADSLLHNPYVTQMDLADQAPAGEVGWRGAEYQLEDEAAARAVLHRQFAAVVGNPPYITVKDAVLRDRYRALYPRSAAGKYSVAAPFTERFFLLARSGGRVGMITANSFMKREFGKKLIQDYLPKVNLDVVINTSGAYIPGHGTPTVLLFGSQDGPKGKDVLTVLASRGEPSTPDDPEQGLVWRSIADHWSEVGFENEYITVVRTGRDVLGKHPWSLGGGGAAELKELLEERAEKRLKDVADSVGVMAVTLQDEVFVRPEGAWRRGKVGASELRALVVGEEIRDWALGPSELALFPYKDEIAAISQDGQRAMWPWRAHLSANLLFGKTKSQRGLEWYEYGMMIHHKLRSPLSIAFAFVATHNHFVLDRGGKVFKQSAPIIKLPATATEDDHLALLAYLNSSTACFWMKQAFHNKGSGTDSGKWQDNPAKIAYEFVSTQMEQLPLPKLDGQLAPLAARADRIATERGKILDDLLRSAGEASTGEAAAMVAAARENDRLAEGRLIAVQESIDWLIYGAFGLCESDLTSPGIEVVHLGARPFEVRQYATTGETSGMDGQSLGSRADYPQDGVEQERLYALAKDQSLRMLESALYKRRFVITPKDKGGAPLTFDHRLAERLSLAMADVLERVVADASSTVTLRDCRGKLDAQPGYRSLAIAIFDGFDELRWSSETFRDSSVPYAWQMRFSEAAFPKHLEWQRTWDLQRREDAGEKIDKIPVPPKYAQADYRSATYWQLRGPLDVPKERFISYPGCESDLDGEPVYGWAGWDHEQRAKALATLYWNRKTEESWSTDRLTPMLAGLLELVPWLRQWHAAPSDDYGGDSPASYYSSFLDGQCAELGLTHDQLRAWRPAERAGKAGRRASKAKATSGETP